MEDNLQSVEAALSQPGLGFGGGVQAAPPSPLPATGVGADGANPPGGAGQGADALFSRALDAARAALRQKRSGLLPSNAQADGLSGGWKLNDYFSSFAEGMRKPAAQGSQAPAARLPVPAAAPVREPQPPAPAAARDDAPRIGGAAARQAGVRTMRVGGVSRYGYGGADGVSFVLPDGIDVNDDSAVARAIASNEADYRMMNEIYDEEA